EATHQPDTDDERVLSRRDLLDRGYTPKRITRDVRSGKITRVRRDHYAAPEEADSTAKAVRLGGRLTCVSAIEAGADEIFVLHCDHVHVHAERGLSRPRMPEDRKKRWDRKEARDVRVTWGKLTELPLGRHVVAL